mmetsp:Transcript_8101/g.20203  ORF Transcript_8101/g.20203 Transcript_8101/m.20203 type:complete len:220 (-) Transcript_8101:2192-2851(-)
MPGPGRRLRVKCNGVIPHLVRWLMSARASASRTMAGGVCAPLVAAPSAAKCTGDRPSRRSPGPSEARCSRIVRMTSLRPCRTARSRGRCSSSDRPASTSARASNNAKTASLRPDNTARCKGIWSELALTLTVAEASTMSLMISAFPEAAAACKATWLQLFRLSRLRTTSSTHTASVSNNLQASTWPRAATIASTESPLSLAAHASARFSSNTFITFTWP